MTDTQPTKFCVECKYAVLYQHGAPFRITEWDKSSCFHPTVKTTNVVSGYGVGLPLIGTRETKCKGEWWEEKPKPEPRIVPAPQPRPSIFQRIKNKAKWWSK